MICLTLSQWKWHRDQFASHLEGQYAAPYSMVLAASLGFHLSLVLCSVP